MQSFPRDYPGLFYVDVVWIGLVSIAGVIGNSLALCAVATTPSLRTTTQLNITILAAVDLVVTAVILPCRIVSEYYPDQWPHRESWCHFLAYAIVFFMGYSLQQLMYLSQSRFLRVTKSEAFHRKAAKPLNIIQQVCAVCITSMLVFLPAYTGFGSVGYHPKSHFCFTTGRNQQVLAAVSVVLALVVTPTFYGLTFMYVRAHQRKVQNWQGHSLKRSGKRTGTQTTKAKETVSTSLNDHKKQDESAGTISRQMTDGESSLGQKRSRFDFPKPTDSRKGPEKPIPSISGHSTLEMGKEGPVNRGAGAPVKAVQRSGPTKESVKITRNLLLIFFAYMCCWLPWCLLSLVEPYLDIAVPIYHIINNTIATNSCINPYLYAYMNKNYWNAFKRCLACKCFHRR